MLLKLLRFIKGYVVFSAKGKFPERFINLMNINGIRYWASKPIKKGFEASMIAKDYLYIKQLAKSAEVKVRVKEKYGFPFFVKKYKKRKGFLVGLISGILLITFLSQFIWVVDIRGEEKLGEQEIRPVLEKFGLYAGVYKKSIDNQLLERNTLLELEDLRWMSVNMLNNVAVVEVKEKDKKPYINKKYPCNLKAMCDGVITKTNVENGTNQAKVGSAVVKNQLLVNSVMANGAESVKYVHSEGEIYADVMYDVTFSTDINKINFSPESYFTEKTELNFLRFNFPGNMSSSLKGNKMNVYENYRFIINDVVLPMGFMKERSYYFDEKQMAYDYKLSLKNQLSLYELFNEKNSKIKERKVEISEKNNTAKLNVHYVVNKNIAQKQKIKVKY